MKTLLQKPFPSVVLCAFLLGGALFPAHAATPVFNAAEGHINFDKHTDRPDDSYTDNPSPSVIQFMNTHWARLMTFSPYWDSKLSFYPNAWAYDDSYALHSAVDGGQDFQTYQQSHPGWILTDGQNPLFINFDCGHPYNGGTVCTQYAANITDPNGFRAWWIAQAQHYFALHPAYKGLWVDDVNLDITRVSDGNGNPVTPIDPATGQSMTNTAWQTYFADFMEQIRAAFPSVEIVHNSIWFAGDPTSAQIHRQIVAADFINLERGVNDSNLTHATYLNLLAFIDAVHALGKGVIFDNDKDNTDTDLAREYSAASYLLINNGKDLVGDFKETPSHWWSGFDTDLGAAQGARYSWNNLLRRDFAKGIALVNPPGSGSVSVTFSDHYQRVDGSVITSLTLSAGQGAILIVVTPSCTALNFTGGSVSPASVPPSGSYTVFCDYGAVVNGIAPRVGSGFCQWVGFAGTAAQYDCTAGSTPGTFANTCQAFAGTANLLCPRTDAIASLQVSAPGLPPPPTLASSLTQVKVYPNPWRSDRHVPAAITFDGLTQGSDVRLFNVSGHKVKEFHSDGPTAAWDLTNDSGDKVASGIYIYLITDNQSGKIRGKIAVIK